MNKRKRAKDSAKQAVKQAVREAMSRRSDDPLGSIFTEPENPEPYLGDTRFLHRAETCSKCFHPMEPRVFFGQVIGWRCDTCNPVSLKGWSMADCNVKVDSTFSARL